MKEKSIKGYNNIFKINTKGEVFRETADGLKRLNPIKTLNTIQVNLYDNGNSNRVSLARLVYSTFVRELKRNEFIKYKDGNFENVELENLEVVNFIPKKKAKFSDKFDYGDNEIILKMLGCSSKTRNEQTEIINSIKQGEKQNEKTERVLKDFFSAKEKAISEAKNNLKKVKKNVSTLNTLVNKKGKITYMVANNIQNAISELRENIDKTK